MEVDTERDQGSDRYWRRRVAVLGCGLGAVGLLAWACSGATGDDGPVREAGASPPPAPTAMPTVTVTTTTTPEPSGGDGGPCRDADLVVGMSASRAVYAAGERPEFQVTVVNVGAGTCTFDAGSLDVRVTSGDDRIWSSARCRDGEAPRERLRRGVPYTDTVTWDRRRGCDGGTAARPGTYVADLKGQEAKKQVFRLR